MGAGFAAAGCVTTEGGGADVETPIGAEKGVGEEVEVVDLDAEAAAGGLAVELLDEAALVLDVADALEPDATGFVVAAAGFASDFTAAAGAEDDDEEEEEEEDDVALVVLLLVAVGFAGVVADEAAGFTPVVAADEEGFDVAAATEATAAIVGGVALVVVLAFAAAVGVVVLVAAGLALGVAAVVVTPDFVEVVVADAAAGLVVVDEAAVALAPVAGVVGAAAAGDAAGFGVAGFAAAVVAAGDFAGVVAAAAAAGVLAVVAVGFGGGVSVTDLLVAVLARRLRPLAGEVAIDSASASLSASSLIAPSTGEEAGALSSLVAEVAEEVAAVVGV